MTSPSRIPVEEIREAARLAVEATSLRAVARAVKLSPMGLRHFLDGREPYSATRRKLNAWFATQAGLRPEYADPVIRASLASMLEGIPEPRRDVAARRLLEMLETVYAEQGALPPSWLARLRDE